MATKKPIKTIIKLQIPAASATPAPPVGTVLGPQGLNIQDFVKRFNDATADKRGDIIPVEITVYKDRSFDFQLKSPPASDLLRKAAGIEKGSASPLKTKIGKVTKEQIKQIAQRKMEDLNTDSIEAATRIIKGTARSMGIEVAER